MRVKITFEVVLPDADTDEKAFKETEWILPALLEQIDGNEDIENYSREVI